MNSCCHFKLISSGNVNGAKPQQVVRGLSSKFSLLQTLSTKGNALAIYLAVLQCTHIMNRLFPWRHRSWYVLA